MVPKETCYVHVSTSSIILIVIKTTPYNFTEISEYFLWNIKSKLYLKVSIRPAYNESK